MATFVSTSYTGIRQTFGRVTKLLQPGIHFYMPGLQKITKVSNKLRHDTFLFDVKTRDNVFTKIGLSIQYRVEAENTSLAFFSLENPQGQIDSYIENIVRSKVPTMTLSELFEAQYEICKAVSDDVSSKMKKYGFTLENTLVTEVIPDKSVVDAMNKVFASNQLKNVAENEANANYITEIRKAEADKERKRLLGEGVSLQRLAILSGYENSVQSMATKLDVTPKDIINFVTNVLHLDMMESVGKSENAKVVFIDNKPNNFMSDIKKSIIEANETR
jgi:regulator of protease activity HflC (stomatin/prohibitin superfamily)